MRAFGRTGADSPDDEADDSPCDPVRVHPKSPDDQADSPDDQGLMTRHVKGVFSRGVF